MKYTPEKNPTRAKLHATSEIDDVDNFPNWTHPLLQLCSFRFRLPPRRIAEFSAWWGHTKPIAGTIEEPQPRFGDRPVKFQVFCPPNGTAVLKGLRAYTACEYVFRRNPRSRSCYVQSSSIAFWFYKYSYNSYRGPIFFYEDRMVFIFSYLSPTVLTFPPKVA